MTISTTVFSLFVTLVSFFSAATVRSIAEVGRCDQEIKVDKFGGWDEWTDETDGPCTVNRVDIASLSAEEFNRLYLEQKPVVLTGLWSNLSTNETPFQQLCSRERLLNDWGHSKITLSTANTYSHEKVTTTLWDYIHNHMHPQDPEASGSDTLYHFGDNNHAEWAALFDMYPIPPFVPSDAVTALSWGLAGANTGVPFHIHGAGYSAPIWGRKRWFLTGPEFKPAFDPEETTYRWARQGLRAARKEPNFMECTIHPGEAMYFPSKWWHATLNLDQGVFISTFVQYSAQTLLYLSNSTSRQQVDALFDKL